MNWLSQKIRAFVSYFAEKTADKLEGNFFGLVASLLLAGGSTIFGYLLGATEQTASRFSANDMGAYCLGSTIREIQNLPNSPFADDENLDHLMVCHGKLHDIEGDADHFAARLTAIFPECFKQEKGLISLDTSSSAVSIAENEHDTSVATCSCELGHPRLLARHLDRWCSSIPPPDFRLFPSI